MPSFTPEQLLQDAASSIEALVKVANRGTGASEAAATVLLSAYNSYKFTIPIHDLCALDEANYIHALKVITARYYSIEPQELIVNGSKIFTQLWDDWKHLRVSQNSEIA